MKLELAIPDKMLHEMLDSVALPPMARVRYTMPTPAPLADVGAEVYSQARAAAGEIRTGQRIAIGVGSRGIAQLPEIVAALVRALRDQGAEPFIIPAMGSHGGATSQGQEEVLRHLGITAERVGAPVLSSMETVQVGTAADQTPVRLDRLAMEADGIVFVARIKPHTAFRGPYESGLAKMIAIGLGKQSGAAACHARGFSQMHRMVPALAEVALAQAPIRFAIAVLENAADQPFKVLCVQARHILAGEPALLDEARAAMPRLPFDELDILVIDAIGKNISGDGADPNITGRYPTADAGGGPAVTKLVMLDLTEATDGNANGLGLADFITIHAARKFSLAHTYPNALTSTVARTVALPMILPSDQLALAAAVLTCNAVGRAPRMLRIANTLQLETLWLSPALLDEGAADPRLKRLVAPAAMGFDAQGDLIDLAPMRDRRVPP